MARLIDADEAKAKIIAFSTECNSMILPIDAILMILNQIDTVDAVPVVRCRECVGRPFWEEDHNGVPVCLLSGLYVRSEDDFCSYGESKEGAD